MKKAIALVTVLSSLALSIVPALADSNGNITINGGTGNNYTINQTTTVNSGTTINLTDIGGSWAEKYIKDLVKKGILSGDTNHKFNPNADVSRAQWATMVTRYFGLKATSTTTFNDVPSTSWEYKYVEAAAPYFDAYNDINGGIDFKPNAGAKREDVTYTLVSILVQMNPNVQLVDPQTSDLLLQAKFKDANDIAPSLRPYVATALKYDLISGDGKGHFLPDKTLSRAEAATLLDKLQGNSVVLGGGLTTGGTTTGGTTTGTTDGGSTIGTTDGGSTIGTTDGGSTTTTTDGGSTDGTTGGGTTDGSTDGGSITTSGN